MNLGLEYLIRSGVVKDLVKLPCSLFLQKGGEKRVAVMLNRHDKNCIQQWDISSCNDEQALPPMNEYEVVDLFDNPYLFRDGYHPIGYEEKSIPMKANVYGHPMDQYLYEVFFDSMTYSFAHRLRRAEWLWRAFCAIYDFYLFKKMIFSNDMFIEQDFLKKRLPKKWRFWLMWVNYMMPDIKIEQIVPAELAFTSFSS